MEKGKFSRFVGRDKAGYGRRPTRETVGRRSLHSLVPPYNCCNNRQLSPLGLVLAGKWPVNDSQLKPIGEQS
jgi:hypothetical protein